MGIISPKYLSEKRISSGEINKIYIFTEPHYKDREWEGKRKGQGKGFLKIGDTLKTSQERVKTQHPVKGPDGEDWEILHSQPAINISNQQFPDHYVHAILKQKGIESRKDVVKDGGKEWFECTLDEAISAINEAVHKTEFQTNRTKNFKMRPEQVEAVKQTANYFNSVKNEEGRTPKYLWNAKMRFGKTFTAYQLAKQMEWKKILVLTYVPAVEDEWENNLLEHVDFDGWYFVSNKQTDKSFNHYEKVCFFSSLQDILGKDGYGDVKSKFKEVYEESWDCIIIDEYHFGARTKKSKATIDQDTGWKLETSELNDGIDVVNLGETNISEELIKRSPLKTSNYLFLSGTPFKSLDEGEFDENQIFSWSYIDEQMAKDNWSSKNSNPYSELPQMVLMTYDIPSEIRNIAMDTNLNEFNISEFFRAEKNSNGDYEFVHKNEVQKWLDFIRGDYLLGNLKPGSGYERPVLPFYDTIVKSNLNHTLWMLPRVASCNAMENLLSEAQNNRFSSEYEIINVSGSNVGTGKKAKVPVENTIKNGLDTKSITLTCEKLSQGVTVPQWGGVFMLRNMESPQYYFQTIFRCQSPWVVDEKNDSKIIKKYCYVFDFSVNRTLKQAKNFIDGSQIRGSTLEEKVKNTLNFLPVLAYNGLEMVLLDAKNLISIATGGLGMKMLSRRWSDKKLVQVDNLVLERLLNRPDLIKILEEVPYFRVENFGEDVEAVVSREASLQSKSKDSEKLNQVEKDQKKKDTNKRDKWRKNLLKIIQRIPIFMYLTDYREDSLGDVIKKIEPELFKDVTFVDKEVFEDFCNIGIFNSINLDQTIGDFRRLEEASLNYMGGGNQETKVGLLDTVISREDL